MQAPREGHAPSGAGRNVGFNQKLIAAAVAASEVLGHEKWTYG
jgi:hypothetical protein